MPAGTETSYRHRITRNKKAHFIHLNNGIHIILLRKCYEYSIGIAYVSVRARIEILNFVFTIASNKTD